MYYVGQCSHKMLIFYLCNVHTLVTSEAKCNLSSSHYTFIGVEHYYFALTMHTALRTVLVHHLSCSSSEMMIFYLAWWNFIYDNKRMTKLIKFLRKTRNFTVKFLSKPTKTCGYCWKELLKHHLTMLKELKPHLLRKKVKTPLIIHKSSHVVLYPFISY